MLAVYGHRGHPLLQGQRWQVSLQQRASWDQSHCTSSRGDRERDFALKSVLRAVSCSSSTPLRAERAAAGDSWLAWGCGERVQQGDGAHGAPCRGQPVIGCLGFQSSPWTRGGSHQILMGLTKYGLLCHSRGSSSTGKQPCSASASCGCASLKVDSR